MCFWSRESAQRGKTRVSNEEVQMSLVIYNLTLSAKVFLKIGTYTIVHISSRILLKIK